MSVADFRKDVSDPDVLKAEDIAFETISAYFNGTPVSVEDTRPEKVAWDFIIHRDRREERLDVKFDKWYERSKRIPFEIGDENGGRFKPTWGVNGHLHWIALVPWSYSRIVLMPLHFIRGLVLYAEHFHSIDTLQSKYNWSLRETPNLHGSVTHCWVIPESQVNAWLDLHGQSPMQVLITDARHHRSIEPGGVYLHGIDQGEAALQRMRGGGG